MPNIEEWNEVWRGRGWWWWWTVTGGGGEGLGLLIPAEMCVCVCSTVYSYLRRRCVEFEGSERMLQRRDTEERVVHKCVHTSVRAQA